MTLADLIDFVDWLLIILYVPRIEGINQTSGPIRSAPIAVDSCLPERICVVSRVLADDTLSGI